MPIADFAPVPAQRAAALVHWLKPGLSVRAWLVGSGLILLLGGTCGCVSTVDSGSVFAGVENDVTTRSGGRLRVRWNRSAADDAAAAQAVAVLLQHGPLTAQRAAQIALLNNRGLQARFEEIGIAHADYIQAGLLSNPRFSASWRFPNKPPTGTDAEYALAGNVLELFLLPARRRVAARELARAQARVAAEVFGLIAETEIAVYTLQARQQLLGRLQLILQTNEAAADLARRQREAGNITELALGSQQVFATQARVDVLQTQAQLRSDRERLNRLLGFTGADAAGWQVASALPPLPAREPSLADAEARALRQRLDLIQARQLVDAVGQALALKTHTRYLPAALQLGVNTERTPDRQRVTGPTLDLELPIFDQGQGAVARLAAQYRQAQRQLEAAEVNARSEVREARDLVLTQRRLAEFYGVTLLPQRRAIVSQTQLQYNAMIQGAYDLLAARERELATERAALDARRDYWIARAQLERALVGGTWHGGE
ncbi:MAG: TolC family protein [Verrucomicrobia bacterium]|nr:TolC family protein [Verrucomicrobiota bacterium]